MTDRQKIFLGLAAVAAAMLALAICRALQSPRGFPYGYYVFMRIVTCGALVGLLLEKFPVWIRFPLILLAILYNPIVLVHLGDQEVWACLNALTIPAFVVPWIVVFFRKRKEVPDGPR